MISAKRVKELQGIYNKAKGETGAMQMLVAEAAMYDAAVTLLGEVIQQKAFLTDRGEAFINNSLGGKGLDEFLQGEASQALSTFKY